MNRNGEKIFAKNNSMSEKNRNFAFQNTEKIYKSYKTK